MFEKLKPSQYLRKYLSGGSSGFEIDDLISSHQDDPKYHGVIDEILRMMSASNDQALASENDRFALSQLAAALEQQGR